MILPASPRRRWSRLLIAYTTINNVEEKEDGDNYEKDDKEKEDKVEEE